MGIWQSRFYTLALALALSLDALPPFSLWQTEGWISEQVANVTRTTCVHHPLFFYLEELTCVARGKIVGLQVLCIFDCNAARSKNHYVRRLT